MRKALSCFLVAAVLALTPALIVRNRSGSSRDGVDTLWMGTKDIESSKKGIHQIAGIGTSICFLLFSSEVSHAIGEDISYKLVIHFPPFRVFLLPTFLISLTNFRGKQPPVDKSDPKRCVLQSSSMGQANAARNKLYDLRECKLDPKSQSGAGKDMSGAVFSEADFTGTFFYYISFLFHYPCIIFQYMYLQVLTLKKLNYLKFMLGIVSSSIVTSLMESLIALVLMVLI